MGSLSIWHWIILLVVLLLVAALIFGVYWLIRRAVRAGNRDAQVSSRPADWYRGPPDQSRDAGPGAPGSP